MRLSIGLTLRMQIRRLTRLTDAHSKKWENHEAAIALFIAYYNFCRVHSTIKMSPARKARVDGPCVERQRAVDEDGWINAIVRHYRSLAAIDTLQNVGGGSGNEAAERRTRRAGIAVFRDSTSLEPARPVNAVVLPWSIMKSDRIEPTPEMLAFYERRTNEHVERVRRCLTLLAGLTDYAEELIERARVHDASKFGPDERIPYVWLTEYHRLRRNGEPFDYPEGVAERVNLAIRHHVTTNRHHPEFHADPNDMSDVDLIEMVCDWTAMAQEFSQDGGSARGWADKTIGKRVAFNANKRRFIYQMIEELDRQFAANP